MRMGFSFDAFGRESLEKLLKAQEEKISNTINTEDENYLLNVNETDYTEHLIATNKIEPVSLDFENATISDEELLIPSERFPYGYSVTPGKSYKKNVIVFHIPFEGDYNLLGYKTNPYMDWYPSLKIIENCICFDIVSFDDKPETIKRDTDRFITDFKKLLDFHTKQITKFNELLPIFIQSHIKLRKEAILKKRSLVASLGIPIKKVDRLPSTYSVPIPRIRQKIKVKPEVKENSFTPDPSLDDTTYTDILQLIHDVGQIFEKYPSTYEGKDEEALRDLFIFQLQPRFEGETSAETFNKTGKTDIIIKHEGKNLFVAECKFWHGQKQYLEAIDQLLSYLTWRDSKAAIIMFVKNKEFSTVLSQIKDSSAKHLNFLKLVDQQDDTWFNFFFHIPGDRNKIVKMAILLFHVPSE